MITVNDTARVRTLVMNRPEALNALNGQLARELTQALQDAADDDNVRVLILTGNGKAFSAGADLSGPRFSGIGGSTRAPRPAPTEPPREPEVNPANEPMQGAPAQQPPTPSTPSPASKPTAKPERQKK